MTFAINHPAHWRRVLAQRCLFAALEVDPVDVPVHTGTEGLVVIFAEANVQDRSTMFECPDQRAVGAVLAAGVCVVEIDLLVPRRSQQPRRHGRREDDGGDGVVWWLREFELGCCERGGRSRGQLFGPLLAGANGSRECGRQHTWCHIGW